LKASGIANPRESLAKLAAADIDLVNSFGGSAISEDEPDAIHRMLAAVREHMGMEIAYISEFVTESLYDTVVFRGVDAPGFEHLLAAGDCKKREDTYCHHVMAGSLPGLMTDTAMYPAARHLAVTYSMPVRAHIGVPIYLQDGTVYGMLCCISPNADPTLNDRDMQVMKVFADMAAHQINGELRIRTDLSDASVRIERMIQHDEFKFAYQPILTLTPLHLVGFEALCRFAPEPYRPPDQWFREAARVGLGAELELAALRIALRAFAVLPDDLFISVNVSPETILNSAFIEQFCDCSKSRLVLEITEHTKVDDYGALLAALAPLRAQGARLSIDDAGAGFASLRHILNLSPDIVKLDIGLTKAIDMDPARRALAAALVYFAKDTQSQIIAEGVETESELAVLKSLGITMGQGYLLGRPTNLASSKLLCEMAPPWQSFEMKSAHNATPNGAFSA
jgi:EAL domain-containing protein (putative c-di-GMP-specific phosphodiesterase class I)